MKVLSKKITMIALSVLFFVCLGLSGLFAFSQPTKTHAATDLETEFTNNGQFSVSQYGSNTFEYVEGVNGSEGAVLKIDVPSGSGSAYIKFNAPNVLASDVESIVVKMYSPEYGTSDSFRASNADTSAGWLMNAAYNMSDWCEITLADSLIAKMTDANGYLSNQILFGARVHGAATMYYIDSITITYTQEFYEKEFTGDGQFSVSQYGPNTFEYVENVNGSEGAVLKITVPSGSGSAYIKFNAPNVLASDVESIVVKMYSPEYGTSDSFRASNADTSAGWLMNTAYNMSDWCEITLADSLIAKMTDANGYLSNQILFGARVHGAATVYYIDSITVNMKEVEAPKETTKVTFSSINVAWNNNAVQGMHCTFLLFDGGISGNGDLDGDFSDLISKMTIDGEAVDANNILFRCPNWIGASGGIIMCITTNPEVGSVLCLPAGATFDIGGTDTNVYEITQDIYMQFNGTAWAVCEKPVELEMATFVGPWGSTAFNSSNQVLLQYSSESAWDYTNKGYLASKITYKNSKTNATYSATESNIAGWDGQKWIVLSGMSGYDIIEIATGGTFGGNIEIPALTLYNVNGFWVTTAPHTATTNYTIIAGGWNNNVVGGLSNNILVFDVNPLGNAADATNLAATMNRTSLMVKYNGATFADLYTQNNQYAISYAHGSNYFYFAIPEADLVEGAIFEIEDGTPFMNAYLGGVKLVYNGSEWEECAPDMTPTVEFSAIGAGGAWNNLVGSDNVTSHTIIAYSAVLDGASGTADGTNLAASANWTSKMVKFNGKSFYELYQTNHQYQISYAHGGKYFYFVMPISALVATENYPVPTLTLEDGTPFMAQYLPATTLYLQDGVWTDVLNTTNYNPDFVSIGSLNHYDNTAMNAYGLSLIYDTTGFTTDGNQVPAASATGFTLNGETVNPALWGGEQLLFWLAKNKCSAGYNGYSHATLVIEDGATLTNDSGKTFTLGGATLYLVDGAWTTMQPDGYHILANFTDFHRRRCIFDLRIMRWPWLTKNSISHSLVVRTFACAHRLCSFFL